MGLEKIVIVGGFAAALGPSYLNILRKEFRRYTQDGFFSGDVDTYFELAPESDKAALLGAAAFALSRIGSTA